MMQKLVIGNCNYSSWSLRPWLFLRHHGIPFEEQRISLFTETMWQELAGYFSGDKVPILLDQGVQIWDSIAILEYLAEKYPQARGWPDQPAARAVARSVSAEMHSSFPHVRSELPMNCRRRFPGFEVSSEAREEIDRIEAIWCHCRTHYGEQGPWLFGDFSVADCMYAPMVIRFKGYEIVLNDQAQAYADTLYQSPAVQEWITRGKAETEVIEEDEAPGHSLPM